MRLKVYPEDSRCPFCGRENAAHRTSRSRLVRFLRPDTKMMKCRICLGRYLVRRAPQSNPAP